MNANERAERDPLQIYKLIPKLAAAVGAIGKDKTNRQQGFKYHSIDTLLDRIGPLIAELGICIESEVLKHESHQLNKGFRVCVHMRYRLIAPDGSRVAFEAVGEGADSYDKATNKATAAAFKYAFFQGLAIPTEQTEPPAPIDSDAHSPEVKPKPKEPVFSPPQRFGPDLKNSATASERRDILESAFAASIEGRYADWDRLSNFAQEQFADVTPELIVDVMTRVRKAKSEAGDVFTSPRS